MMGTGDGRRVIGDIVVTSRTLADYRNMFLLEDADLTAGPILDCAAGAATFGAQVRVRKGRVVSVDPAYRASGEALAGRLREDGARIATWLRENPANFDWSYMGSPAVFTRYLDLAAEFFLADYAAEGDRYVAAALPELPFPDATFRLSLCSHLLFCYPDHFSYDDHLAGLLELMRITTDEVRIFPLINSAGVKYPFLGELRRDLQARGVMTEIETANCAFTRGGDRFLRCRRA